MLAVYKKSFRDSRRVILWTTIGLAIYVFIVMSVYPMIYERQEELNELVESYPPELLAMMSGSAAGVFNLAAPGFFLQVYIVTWAVLIVGIMVTFQAFNAITNAERSGTLDLMLSFPVKRRSYLLARMANTATTILLIITGLTVIMLAAMATVPEFDLSLGDLFTAMYGSFFLLIVQAMIAYALAAFVPSSRRWPGGVAIGLFIGAYLLNGFTTSSEFIDSISFLFVFEYYNAAEIVNNGLDLGNMLVLVAAALGFGGLAWWQIDRKELGV